MERRVKDRIDPQLSRYQAGFRRRRSTRQQILLLMERINAALQKDRATGVIAPYPVVFLDISRAFDSVPHEYLLLKLWRAGIRGDELHFFQAFLSERRFRVLTHSHIGDWMPITAGVPQGAVLSPLLYALFINDAVESDDRHDDRSSLLPLLYADDVAVAPGCDGDALERGKQLQLLLDKVGAWARRWRVRFNASKSGCVWFAPKPRRGVTVAGVPRQRFHIDYAPSGSGDVRVVVPNVSCYQYLGVWLDMDCSSERQWAHVRERCATASNMLRCLVNNDGPPGFHVMRSLVRAVIVPRMTYSLPFLSLTRRQYAALDALMYRPLLSVLWLPTHAHRAGLAVRFGLPTAQLCRELALIQFIAAELKLAGDADVRTHWSHYPVLNMVWNRCNGDAVLAKYRQWETASQSRRRVLLQSSSLLDQFVIMAKRWNIIDKLPVDDMRQPLGARWNFDAFKSAVRDAVRRLTCERWLLETRGYSLCHRGIRSGEMIAGAGELKGIMMPPLYGVPVDATDGELSRAAAEMPAGPDSSLLLDTRYHAKLRSRLVHNRASFNAVRHARNNDPNAIRHCEHCHSMGYRPRLETARHAICRCPRYTAQRAVLVRKLRDAMAAVRSRARSRPEGRNPAHGHSVHNQPSVHNPILAHCSDATLLFHVVCCTPFVLCTLRSDAERRRVCRLTGNFLEYLEAVRMRCRGVLT